MIADTARTFATLGEAECYVNGYREAVSQFAIPQCRQEQSRPRGDGFITVLILIYLWALWKFAGE